MNPRELWGSGRIVVILAWAAGCAETPPPPMRPPPLMADPAAQSERTPPSDLDIGVALVKDEKFEEAKPHLEKAVASEPKNPDANYFLGLARAKTGDPTGAEAGFKSALSLDRDFTQAAESLAALYMEEPPRPDAAIEMLQGVLKKRPESPQVHADIARAYGLKGDVGSASKHYEEALARGESVVFRIAYGTMLAHHKERPRAVEQLKKALANAGNDAQMLAAIGRWFGEADTPTECVQAYDRALALKQTDGDWYLRRGKCRQDLRDLPGAITDYQAAIKLAPTDPEPHYRLGTALLPDKKRRTEAVAELEMAIKLGPGTPTAKSANEKLATVKPRSR